MRREMSGCEAGKEAQPDTAANRLLWAVGYETEVAYLIPRLTIEGKEPLKRPPRARPKNIDRTTDWKWETSLYRDTGFQGSK